MFPVYYFVDGRILLVGSSPELFRHHSAFRRGLNPAGLVGILLVMHLVDGEGLARGVRRLSAGHLLSWGDDARTREIQQYTVPVSTRHFDLPFTAHVEILHGVLNDAISRHAPAGARYGLLLSGGRDSRVLAGLLQRHGRDVVPLTFGRRGDFDLECAVPVARKLKYEARTAEVSLEDYPRYAELCVRWEHLSSGLYSVPIWGEFGPILSLPDAVVMGYGMDSVVGGSHIEWAYSPSTRTMSFDTFFERINRYGIRPPVLKRLLRPGVFGDLVPETTKKLRSTYEAYSPLEFQRALCFDLYHRQRFNIGAMVWLKSLAAGPILPALDRMVLEHVAGMPASTLAHRRAEDEILCRWFPELAELPLDRHSADTSPLKPRLRWLVTRAVVRRVRGVWWWNSRRRGGEEERLRYVRLWDFNGPWWVSVRRQAEPFRDLAAEMFDREALDALLPGPDVRVAYQDGIVDSAAAKSLLGLLLWLKRWNE